MTSSSLKEVIDQSTLTDEEQAKQNAEVAHRQSGIEFVKRVDEVNRANWLMGRLTLEFLNNLEQVRQNILKDAVAASNRLGTKEEALRLTLTEVKTIEKIIAYARTGTYTRD